MLRCQILRRKILFGSVDAEAERNKGSIVVIVDQFPVSAHTMPRFHRLSDKAKMLLRNSCSSPPRPKAQGHQARALPAPADLFHINEFFITVSCRLSIACCGFGNAAT
jgi:hypothetical protein